MAKRLVLLSFLKFASAFLFLLRAFRKSSGTVMLLGESYAFSQRPSAFAFLMASIPADLIRPSPINRSTCPMFILDQMLCGLRGRTFVDRRVRQMPAFDRQSIHSKGLCQVLLRKLPFFFRNLFCNTPLKNETNF